MVGFRPESELITAHVFSTNSSATNAKSLDQLHNTSSDPGGKQETDDVSPARTLSPTPQRTRIERDGDT